MFPSPSYKWWWLVRISYDIEKVESLLQDVFLRHLLRVYRGCQEFLKVDGATPVDVYASHYLIDVSDVALQTELFSEYVDAFPKFLLRDGTITVVVQELEDLAYLEFFLTWDQLGGDVLENGGMQSSLWVEILEVFECIHVQRVCICELDLREILDPFVIKSLLSGDAVFWVEGKHLSDHVLSSFRDLVPLWWREAELALLDTLEDQLVVLAVEWRVTTQEDVEDDSTTPNITLLIVLSSEHLRRYVIRGA